MVVLELIYRDYEFEERVFSIIFEEDVSETDIVNKMITSFNLTRDYCEKLASILLRKGFYENEYHTFTLEMKNTVKKEHING